MNNISYKFDQEKARLIELSEIKDNLTGKTDMEKLCYYENKHIENLIKMSDEGVSKTGTEWRLRCSSSIARIDYYRNKMGLCDYVTSIVQNDDLKFRFI